MSAHLSFSSFDRTACPHFILSTRVTVSTRHGHPHGIIDRLLGRILLYKYISEPCVLPFGVTNMKPIRNSAATDNM